MDFRAWEMSYAFVGESDGQLSFPFDQQNCMVKEQFVVPIESFQTFCNLRVPAWCSPFANLSWAWNSKSETQNLHSSALICIHWNHWVHWQPINPFIRPFTQTAAQRLKSSEQPPESVERVRALFWFRGGRVQLVICGWPGQGIFFVLDQPDQRHSGKLVEMVTDCWMAAVKSDCFRDHKRSLRSPFGLVGFRYWERSLAD